MTIHQIARAEDIRRLREFYHPSPWWRRLWNRIRGI